MDTEPNAVNPETIITKGEELGKGSYGTVFRGVYKDSGLEVAVKIVDNEDNLQQEIAILEECNSPNIVKYLGSYVQMDKLWIIMEYCPLGALGDMLKEITKHTTEEQEMEIAVIAGSVLKALDYLHKQKIVHRDIKASNIVKNNGAPLLTDFGIAAQLENSLARKTTQIGTPYWMAPEVIKGKEGYNAKADIWSLGITCIELAEGKPPFYHMQQIRAMFHIVRTPAKGLSNPPTWSDDFNSFVCKCLTIEPEDRPGARELLLHPFIARYNESDVENVIKRLKDTAELIKASSAKSSKSVDE